MGHLIALLVGLVALVASILTLGPSPRRPDGRRGGPVPLGEPNDDDRRTVAEIQQRAAAERQRELEEEAAAAEPYGVPPSDEQRQHVLDTREKSARVRGPVARSLRRQPLAVGITYDDERETVEDLHADARDARLAELADRGIDDPTVEHETAGFPPELPHLPGSELYGYFDCSNCGKQVERAYPGYVDWDAASRDLVCPDCGAIVLRGSAQPAAEEEPAEAPPSSSTSSSTTPPVDVQTTAQPEALSDADRAELEQLRADKQAASQAPPPEPPEHSG